LCEYWEKIGRGGGMSGNIFKRYLMQVSPTPSTFQDSCRDANTFEIQSLAVFWCNAGMFRDSSSTKRWSQSLETVIIGISWRDHLEPLALQHAASPLH